MPSLPRIRIAPRCRVRGVPRQRLSYVCQRESDALAGRTPAAAMAEAAAVTAPTEPKPALIALRQKTLAAPPRANTRHLARLPASVTLSESPGLVSGDPWHEMSGELPMYKPSGRQLPPTCLRCGFPMRISQLPHVYSGTCSETFECALCDGGAVAGVIAAPARVIERRKS